MRQAQAVGEVGILVDERPLRLHLRPRARRVAARQGDAAPGDGVPPAVLYQQPVPRVVRRLRRVGVQRVPRRAAQPRPRLRVRPARLVPGDRQGGEAHGGDALAPPRGWLDARGHPAGHETAERALERQADERQPTGLSRRSPERPQRPPERRRRGALPIRRRGRAHLGGADGGSHRGGDGRFARAQTAGVQPAVLRRVVRQRLRHVPAVVHRRQAGALVRSGRGVGGAGGFDVRRGGVQTAGYVPRVRVLPLHLALHVGAADVRDALREVRGLVVR